MIARGGGGGGCIYLSSPGRGGGGIFFGVEVRWDVGFRGGGSPFLPTLLTYVSTTSKNALSTLQFSTV